MLVAGAGAIGQWLGLRLLQGGRQVCLLTRPVHAQAIAAQGLQVHGASTADGHPTCITSPEQVNGPFAAIVVTAKAHATSAVAHAVAPLLAPDGVMLSLQNGFGNAAKLARVVGPDRVAQAVTSHGVTLERPGHLLHAGTGPTVVGPGDLEGAPSPAGRRSALQALRLLEAARLAPEWRDDMRGAVWTKGLLNHAINPVATLAGAPNGHLRDGPLHEQAVRLLDEGYALSRAAGVAVVPLRPAFEDVLARTVANRCSMLQDVEARRPTEIEQISGHLVRLARRLGYPLPESEVVYRRVKELEASYLGREASLALTRQEIEA